jgi:DNA-binding transcriptional LysR family regulator
MRTPAAAQWWLDWWAVNPRPDGSTPRWWPRTTRNIDDLLEQVAEGQCVATVPASVATYYPRPDLVFLPIVDIDPMKIALGWLEGNESQLIESFAEIVREIR